MLGRKKAKLPKITSIVAEHNLLIGELHFSGGLHLDGRVRGEVIGQEDMNSTLIVSKSGAVEGNVRVVNLILDGTIVGDVEAENKVQLMEGARVTGTVHYRALEMAEGAEVNGRLVHMDEKNPRLLEHSRRESRDDGGDLVNDGYSDTE